MQLLTMQQAFNRVYDLFGPGSYVGKCDIASDGSCNFEVGNKRTGVYGKGATYEEAIENARNK